MKICPDDGDSLSVKRLAIFFDSSIKIASYRRGSGSNFNLTCDSNMKNPVCLGYNS